MNQPIAQHCAERSLRLRCKCSAGRQLQTQRSRTQQISRMRPRWLSQKRSNCRSRRKQVPRRQASCSVRRSSNIARTTQWKPCTQEKRLTSQHSLKITLLRQLRMASTCSRLRQNQTFVRSTSMLMRSQSLLLCLRSPTRHLLSFRFRRMVYPMNSFCQPTEKTRSCLAMQLMIAFAASLVLRPDRSASWNLMRSTKERKSNTRNSQLGANWAMTQELRTSAKKGRLECRLALELSVMKCR